MASDAGGGAPLCCPKCGAVIVSNSKNRKRRRVRKCNDCKKDGRKSREKTDPIKKMTYRWKRSCFRLDLNDESLWAPSNIEIVMDRWHHKCVVTGETRIEYLTFVPYWDPSIVVPKAEHLVLVTSHVAQSIAKLKNRQTAFPEEVQKYFSE